MLEWKVCKACDLKFLAYIKKLWLLLMHSAFYKNMKSWTILSGREIESTKIAWTSSMIPDNLHPFDGWTVLDVILLLDLISFSWNCSVGGCRVALACQELLQACYNKDKEGWEFIYYSVVTFVQNYSYWFAIRNMYCYFMSKSHAILYLLSTKWRLFPFFKKLTKITADMSLRAKKKKKKEKEEW